MVEDECWPQADDAKRARRSGARDREVSRVFFCVRFPISPLLLSHETDLKLKLTSQMGIGLRRKNNAKNLP